MPATRTERKKAEPRAAPLQVSKPKASPRPQRKAAAPASGQRIGPTASTSRTPRTPSRRAPRDPNELSEKYLRHLRVLHEEAPLYCGFPHCTYYIGKSVEEVNARVCETRGHMKDHYAPKRNEKGELDADGVRDNKAKFRCGWPGCENSREHTVGTIMRHTEQDHLGWEYECPDHEYHKRREAVKTYCRADVLTTHIKKTVRRGHMSKESLVAILDRRIAGSSAGVDHEKENREDGVFSVVPAFLGTQSSVPDRLGQRCDAGETDWEDWVDFDACDDQPPSGDIDDSDHAAPTASLDPFFLGSSPSLPPAA